jgi:hypothetical protein
VGTNAAAAHKFEKPQFFDSCEVNLVRVPIHKLPGRNVRNPVAVAALSFGAISAASCRTQHLAAYPQHDLVRIHTKGFRERVRRVPVKILSYTQPPKLQMDTSNRSTKAGGFQPALDDRVGEMTPPLELRNFSVGPKRLLGWRQPQFQGPAPDLPAGISTFRAQ